MISMKNKKSIFVLLSFAVLFGGGCVSYSGCTSHDDRIRARYEQHFILPNDSSGTRFWKNTKHIFFDVITCCIHEAWRGVARRSYFRLKKEEETAECRRVEQERYAREQHDKKARQEHEAEQSRLRRLERERIANQNARKEVERVEEQRKQMLFNAMREQSERNSNLKGEGK